MYRSDATAIQAWVEEEGPEAFADVVAFVLTTIRTPIERAPTDMEELRQRGEDATCLWGWKRRGYRFVQRNSEELYLAALLAIEKDDDAALLDVLLAVPGLGPAKAGFVAQLCWGRIGCLDSHNLSRLGLDPGDFRLDSCSEATRTQRIQDYIAATMCAGGPQQLWDDWCAWVASVRPDVFDTLADDEGLADAADAVSRIHTLALGLER